MQNQRVRQGLIDTNQRSQSKLDNKLGIDAQEFIKSTVGDRPTSLVAIEGLVADRFHAAE